MSQQIETHLIDEFKAGIEHLSQQEMSRFRNAVRVETVSAERASFDQLGLTAMQPRIGRHGDTQYSDTPHARRWVIPSPYDVADLVDKADRIRVLNDPTNEYTRSFGMAAGRQIDDVIVAAADAAAVTGQNGAGSTAYETDNDIAAGGAGMTMDKILEAKEKLDNNEEDDMSRHIAAGSRQFRDMLGLVEISSADFNTVKALASGRVDGFCGFDFIRSERLTTGGVGSDPADRDCLYWQKSALLLGQAESGQATIDRLPQKRNSIQVLYQIDMGATRMRETGVGRIECAES
jgi:hypothetical protein